MATNENLIPIPGRLHSVATEGHVAGADEIIDDALQKDQATINAENSTALEGKVDKEEGKGLSANDYSDAEKAKVASHESALATGGSVDTRIATAINALDAEASQSAGSDGLALSVSEVDGKITSISGSIAAGTYATLDNGKVPSSQLPSYVDDVIEGYYYNNKFYKEAAHTTEITGETGKIYVDLSTNDSYRWSGSAYIKVGDSSGIAELQSQINAIKGGSSKSIATLDSQDTALGNRITTLETAVGTGGSVDSRISSAVDTAKSEVIGDASSDYNTLGKIEDALENNALLAQGDSSSVIADFDPQSDTVWKKAQTLSAAEKETVKHNIGVDKDIEMLEKLYENLTQSDIVVVEDHTQVASPSTNTIYREQGTTSYSDWMYYNNAWQKMATYDNAVDKVPSVQSVNLVESNGINAILDSVENIYNMKKIGVLNFSLWGTNRLRTPILNLEIGKSYVIIPKQGIEDYKYQINISNTETITGGYITKPFRFTAEQGNEYRIVLRNLSGGDIDSSEANRILNSMYYVLYEDAAVFPENGYLEEAKPINLWGSSDFIEGHYYEYSSGNLSVNENCRCTVIDVIPKRRLYIRARYIQIAFFDQDMTYISGVRKDYENNDQESPVVYVDVPYGAVKAGLSARYSSESDFFVSEIPFPSGNIPLSKQVSRRMIPQSQIVQQGLNCIYDRDYFQVKAQCNLASSSGVTLVDGAINVPADNTIYISHLFTTLDRMIVGFFIKINSIDSNMAVRCGTYAQQGAVTDSDAFVDIYADHAILYKGLARHTDKTEEGRVTLSSSIAVNDEIFVSLEKDTINHYVVKIIRNSIIIGLIDLQSSVDPSDADHALNQMRGWGMPILITGSGSSVTVKRIYQYSSGSQYPKIGVVGDSYVENFSRSNQSGWVRLLENIIGQDKIIIAGMGGARTTELKRRLPIELMLFRSQYIILNIGTNDYSLEVDTFKSNLLSLIDMVNSVDSIPVLITVPRRGDVDNSSWISVVNPWIKSLGYKYIDVAYCLSTGDGLTQDTSRYRPDLVHPNHIGAQAIINYVEAYLPQLCQ